MEKSSVPAAAAAAAAVGGTESSAILSPPPLPTSLPHPLLRGLTFHRVRYHVRSLKEDYRIGKGKLIGIFPLFRSALEKQARSFSGHWSHNKVCAK
jgi:hypothetical protein